MSLQVKFAFRKGVIHVSSPFPPPSPSPSSSSSSSLPVGDLPLAPVCRTYRCHRCTFHTNQAKRFLFHQRDEHGDQITIYPCDKCEYASKYKNKLYRHNKLVHKHKFVSKELSVMELDDSATQGSSASSVMNGVDSPDNIADTDSRNENDVLGETEVGFDSEMNFEAVGDLGFENGDRGDVDVGAGAYDMVVDDEMIEMMGEEEDEDKESEGGLEETHPDPTENAYDYIVSTTTVHSPPLFQCRLCTYVNAHKWKIANHIRNTHMKKTLFKCPYCEFVCSRKIEWCIHKTRHTNKTVYSCTECFYRTTMKRNFDRHLSRHRIRGPIKCAMCSYSSTGEAAIQRHMAEYHSSPEKSELENTNRGPMVVKPVKRPASTGSRRLTKIMRTSSHRDAASGASHCITCSICGQVLHSEAKLRVHMASHSDVVSCECPICPLRYKNIADLHAHLKEKHNVEPSDIACLNLSGADVDNTDEIDQDEPLNLSVKEPSEVSEPADGISESTSEGIQQEEPLDLSVAHGRRILFQPENLKCSHCSYLAKWPSDLHRHMLVHSIEKRFKCRYCGKKYKYRFDLNMHLRKTHKIPAGRNRKTGSAAMHHADSMAYFASSGARQARAMDEVDSFGKPIGYTSNRHPVSPGLKCKHCPYVGKYKAEVERHMRLHSGKKPWCCVHCTYKTYWKGDMKRHLQKHHPAEVKAIGNVFDLLAKTFVSYEDTSKTDGDDAAGHEMSESDVQVKTEPVDDYSDVAAMKVNQSEASADKAECQQESEESDVLCKKFCKCPLCAFVCEAPSKLKCHMEIHDNLKRFMCPTCGKRSNWLWDVRKHIRKEHPGVSMEVTVLSEVEALATLEEYFATHSQASARNSPAKPDGLDGTDDSASNASFDTPLTKSPKQPGYGVRCRPYKCSMCGRRSNWKWDLNKHIKTVHPGATVIVLSEEEARATLHEVMPYTKPRKAEAPRPVQVANDVSPRSKQSSMLKQLTAMRCRPFKCSRCGQRSNWKWDLKKHIRMNHASAHVIILNEQEAISTAMVSKSYNRGTMPNSLKRFRCTICEYQANYRSDVLRHLRRVHQCSEAQVIMQNIRELPPPEMKTKSLLEKYMTSEISVSSSPQTDDDATVNGSDTPDMTSPNVTPIDAALSQKLWRCSKCNFRDRNKGVVVHHYRTHSYGTAFACRICGDTSDYRNSIYRHIRNKHQREDYTEIIVETAIHPEKVDNEGTVTVKALTPTTRHDVSMLPQSSKLYRCHDCGVTSGYKSAIVQHCKMEHHSNGAEDTIQEIYTSSPMKSPNDVSMATATKAVLTVPVVKRRSPVSSQASDPKPLHCTLCPYKTNKSGLLKLHNSYHKPQSGNNFKCKYCPYYVCAMRLLHQHMRLHLAEQGIIKDEEDAAVVPSIADTSITKVVSFSPTKSPTKSARTKYYCDKCPYSSTNRNDSLYHKQFHRPRASAPYKCDHCPYWVTYRRLLSQHMRVHFRQVEPPQETSSRDGMSSIEASPCKSDTSVSDYLTEDVVKVAHIKQKIIASKITRVPITPEKLQQLESPQVPSSSSMLVPGYIVNRRGHLMLSGSYRKLHRCRFCPYTNVRGVNLRLHEKMHGYRGISSITGKELLKCPYCDYHVANKGLLTHHVKVHSHQYRPGIDEINDTEKLDSENDENNDDDDAISISTMSRIEVKSPQLNVKDLPKNVAYYVKYDDNTGEHILEKVLTKKWSCEKCPYVSGKKAQFERHVLLHGSKQKYLCEYCDYSVPAYQLLVEHRKLHLKPNPNLLSVQSILNLQQLPEVPADVAAAANFTGSSAGSESNSVNGDELNLYENSTCFEEPKKLYRCDRCPYTNVRRDILLTHLKFHMIRSDLTCPYCDYSVDRTNLLNQHIKVHFSQQDSDDSLPQKLIGGRLVEKLRTAKVDDTSVDNTLEDSNSTADDASEVKTEELNGEDQEVKEAYNEGQDKVTNDAKEKGGGGEGGGGGGGGGGDKKATVWVCQYCDRVFDASEKLVRHEMQHLMGNQF